MKDWPLVGRGGELSRLMSRLLGDVPTSVVLAGPVGVGKSRLAAEVLAAAERAGRATVRVVATPAAAELAFGALGPFLPPLHEGDLGRVEHRGDLLRWCASTLVERAEGRGLVVLVDDAHLLDDASAAVFHQMAVTGAASLLATVRAGAPAPEAVRALWKDEIGERVDLAGLSVEAIGELLTEVLDGPVGQATVLQLAVRCEGNVLFLRELVLGALDDGVLRADAGMWHLTGALSPSTRLIELVEARLAGIDADERAVLELVAFAEPLGSAELAELSDPTVAERLDRAGLITSRLNGRRLEVGLVHPLYGDVVRAHLPALRARALARSLAEVVEGTGSRRHTDVLRVAVWRMDGGGGTPSLLLAGAEAARRSFDFPLAERLARRAVDAGAGFEAALLAARMTGVQEGRGTQAERELTALAATAADDSQRGRVATARLENLLGGLGDFERGRRVVEEAEATITDQTWRDELGGLRVGATLLAEGPAAALEALGSLTAGADGSPPAWALVPAAFALARTGRINAALEAIEAGTTGGLRASALFDRNQWTALRCGTLADAGRFHDAEKEAVAAYEKALADRSTLAEATFASVLALVSVERGHVHTAIRHGQQSVALARQVGRSLIVHDGLVRLALAYALAGRADDAARTLSDLDALGLHVAPRDVDRLRARAWTAAAGGNLPLARDTLEEAARVGERIGDLVGATAVLHDVARLGHAKDVAARLTTLARHLEGDLSATRAAHAVALARSDPPAVDDVSRAFDAMGADLLAAEAAADAAVLRRRGGDFRAAAAAEHRARSLAARCGGPSTPALHTVTARAVLTAGEREAAVLASTGRSNKDIAEQLHISVRTVENRLQHVYEKLGISGRAELQAILEADVDGT